VHIAGQRAYDLARAGQAPTLTPRRVLVTRLSLLRYDYPELDLLVECGKGTYIRSLARDLGAALGCGGYVQTLRRTAVGPFTESMAVAPDSLDRASLLAQLQPMRLALAGWPSVSVDAAACRRLRQGQAVLVDCSATALTTTPTPRHVAVLGPDLALVAIGNVDARGWLRPLKVFAG
jgi:tRNA pseudouridine55 synthase